MRSLVYTIPIHPIAWRRAGLSKLTFYDTQKSEKLSTGLYLNSQHQGPKFHGPLHLDITFYMPQPRKVKERTKAPWCDRTPDIDNLLKFLFDSINDTDSIWEDDKQVSELLTKKIYDQNPRTHLIITELE